MITSVPSCFSTVKGTSRQLPFVVLPKFWQMFYNRDRCQPAWSWCYFITTAWSQISPCCICQSSIVSHRETVCYYRLRDACSSLGSHSLLCLPPSMFTTGTGCFQYNPNCWLDIPARQVNSLVVACKISRLFTAGERKCQCRCFVLVPCSCCSPGLCCGWYCTDCTARVIVSSYYWSSGCWTHHCENITNYLAREQRRDPSAN